LEKNEMSPFCIHGPVQLESEAYVTREFERKILQNIYAERWVLILGPRQHGKTTGLIRISQELTSNGFICAFVDLQAFPPAQTYREFLENFARRIAQRLGINAYEPPAEPDDKLVYSWLEKVIPPNKQPVVIIIDEASAIADPQWRDHFYGQIRSIKNEQAMQHSDDLVKRLRFLFSGCFLPDTLVNTKNSPFNICEEILTDDLVFEQAVELYTKVEKRTDIELIEKAFDLMGGNPYLLQLFFHQLYSLQDDQKKSGLQDALDYLFSGQDHHFQYLFKSISEDSELRELVAGMVEKSKIPYDPADPNYKYLRTIGIAKLEDKNLVFRNNLYKTLAENSALFKEMRKTQVETKPAMVPQTVIYGGVNQMKYTNVSVSNSTVSGSIITSSSIRDSFNIIESSKASDELKKVLFELGGAVDEMIKKLPQKEVDEAEDDYKRLIDEATNKSPNPKWYSISIDGLQKAAKKLGEVGEPVLKLSGQILTILTALRSS
jgi:hypothetical protein